LLRRAYQDAQPYALVLTDANMPEVDGFTLVEQIKQDVELGSTIIMMLTSGDRPGDISRCEQLGVAAYLLKPVKQSELFDAIVLALGITDAEQDAPKIASAEQPSRLPSLQILLAEDSLVNQKLAVGLLEKYGHTVVVANDGRQAIAALDAQAFDLVLMDVQMPEMDGFEATAAIRTKENRTGAHIPIIAMTAHAMKGDRERCLEAGMDGYICKPVRVKELFDTIARIGSATTKTKEADVELRGVAEVDWDSVLDRVGGNRKALQEVVRFFCEVECPELMKKLREAIAESDAALLGRAAHTLKGLLEFFAAKHAFEAARTLEVMGSQDDLGGAGTVLATLQEEIALLTLSLNAFDSETLP